MGIPCRKYINQERDPKTKRFKKEPQNDGEIIFDRELTPKGEDEFNDKFYWAYKGHSFANRYWETWIRDKRNHPLLIKVVRELKKRSNGRCAKLKIVKIPNNIEYEIEEYDGIEWIAEKHRTWS